MMVANVPNPKPIKFSATVDEAIAEAKKKRMPFLIFFCTADVASTSGENEEAYEAYRKAHKGEAPRWTVFDCHICTGIMRKKGIAAFVKVPNTEANKELFRYYNANDNMLLICTPEGNSVLSTTGNNHNGMVSLLNEYDSSRKEVIGKK